MQPPLAILRNKNGHPSTRMKSSQSQSGPLLCRHMLVGSRPSRTTLSHRLQSLLGAPCWSWTDLKAPCRLAYDFPGVSQAILGHSCFSLSFSTPHPLHLRAHSG